MWLLAPFSTRNSSKRPMSSPPLPVGKNLLMAGAFKRNKVVDTKCILLLRTLFGQNVVLESKVGITGGAVGSAKVLKKTRAST